MSSDIKIRSSVSAAGVTPSSAAYGAVPSTKAAATPSRAATPAVKNFGSAGNVGYIGQTAGSRAGLGGGSLSTGAELGETGASTKCFGLIGGFLGELCGGGGGGYGHHGGIPTTPATPPSTPVTTPVSGGYSSGGTSSGQGNCNTGSGGSSSSNNNNGGSWSIRNPFGMWYGS